MWLAYKKLTKMKIFQNRRKKVILFFSEEMRNQIIEIMDKHSMSHKNGEKYEFYSSKI